MQLKSIEKTVLYVVTASSVAIEAPSDRATGAQRFFQNKQPSIHLQWNGEYSPFQSPRRVSLPVRVVLTPDETNLKE